MPAEAGIQKETEFRVKPGMTNRYFSPIPQSEIGNPHSDDSLFLEPSYLLFTQPQIFTQNELIVLSHQG